MFALSPGLGRDRPLRLLCLGAHADDIEIGAGGTVLRLLRERPRTEVTLAVVTGDAERQAEARASAEVLLAGAASRELHLPGFEDGYLPAQAHDLKRWAQTTLGGLQPDVVLTHRLDDAHQDHRALAALAWQTWRGATIAHYEIPKWDGDLGRPNVYVTLDDELLQAKLDLLDTQFAGQRRKGWYDEETFRGLARVRGVEAGARYAEAFECTKMVW